jgi:hypothetical protein
VSIVERARALRAARHDRERIATRVAADLQAAETERAAGLVTVRRSTLAALARSVAKPKPKPAPKPDDLDDDVIDDGRDDDARQALPSLPRLSHVEGFYDPGPVPFVFGATKGTTR